MAETTTADLLHSLLNRIQEWTVRDMADRTASAVLADRAKFGLWGARHLTRHLMARPRAYLEGNAAISGVIFDRRRTSFRSPLPHRLKGHVSIGMTKMPTTLAPIIP